MGNASRGRLLMKLGAVLFLLGLLTGFAIGAVENPRMGLTSHLEGVMNGTFLVAVGAIWTQLRLGDRAQKIAVALLAYGTYVNWLSTLLAAVWGTGRMTPIAAPGLEGTDMQEAIVNFGLLSLSIAIVVATVMIIVGLRGASADVETA